MMKYLLSERFKHSTKWKPGFCCYAGFCFFLNNILRAGEMAQELRGHGALVEDQRSGHPHPLTHNSLYLQLWESDTLF